MQVQKLRLIKGWSQQQLADFSGLSVRTVQRIEAGQPARSLGGRRETPDADLLRMRMMEG